MRRYLSFLFMLPFIAGCSFTDNNQGDKMDVLSYVNPFIGTGGHGHTFPGAAYPSGMVQLSPDTGLDGWDWCSGYHYSDSSIIGFSHTHLSGTGRSDLLDVMLMPTVGKLKLEPGSKTRPGEGYRSRFSHDEEVASPGYYKVRLRDYDIMAELTVSPRCGFHRYTFPENKDAHIILDLSHHYASDSVLSTSVNIVDSCTLTGIRKTKGWGEPGEKYWVNQELFYAIKVSKPFHADITTDNRRSEDKTATGKEVKVAMNFETSKNEMVLVKVGISSVSIQNAMDNLSAEIPGWDFNDILTQAQLKWEHELAKIKVKAPEKTRTIFYTALYHSLITPHLFNDVNKEYIGFDGKTHEAADFKNYTALSLWDTFRSLNPLLTLLDSNKVNDIVKSMLAQYDQYGLLPVWPLWSSETNCMIGYHSVPVIVDAYFKGIRNYDVEKAYAAMKHSAMQDGFGIKELKQFGYIPYDQYNKSVSTALEYCYDDWCIARMAKDLGKEDDYNYFMKRAMTYPTYFDKEYKLMNGISSSGSFRRPFDPFFSSYGPSDWVEGNSWQYSFFVPHDVQGLINLHGGAAAFGQALDSLFTVKDKVSGENVPVDISGLIGQYAHGNEPSHHVAYLYDYIGKPFKTQEKLQQIMTTLYTDQPDGLSGNDDCGQMSAWYVFSAMGIYPVNPAEGVYVFGKPMVSSASININNKVFTVKAIGLSDKNIYIQSVKLNGKNYNKLFITHKDMAEGGELEFTMGATPADFDGAVLPPSVSKSL
ncbi:GH92 family glycosyl hydrolase [Chitinophaga sp. Cy-1792]|uniref:GH92 family glycosyl hydrolase n=1 Tax=Chitinophaga sp. Cy-1792 TaxID=2608339 RepID=UPI001421C051|nr:GH92 family glycosyl hydrolase [Chitinophaga sp. Cy-1792]NIG56827.1 glycoside hydrolase family 92 protein [Chitinophaga sp. Cy-1792]